MKQRPIIIVWQNGTKITHKHFPQETSFQKAEKIGELNHYGKPIIIGYTLQPKERIFKAAKDVAYGLNYGYPLCCIFHFCIDTLRNRPIQAVLRYTDTTDYIPCKLHIKTYKKPIPEGTF